MKEVDYVELEKLAYCMLIDSNRAEIVKIHDSFNIIILKMFDALDKSNIFYEKKEIEDAVIDLIGVIIKLDFNLDRSL